MLKGSKIAAGPISVKVSLTVSTGNSSIFDEIL